MNFLPVVESVSETGDGPDESNEEGSHDATATIIVE